MGIAGNKFDLFSIEEVTEDEGNKFANEIGSFFYLTSAKESIGIYELFNEVAKQFLECRNNKKYVEENKNAGTKLKKEDSQNKGKKGCC